MAEELANGLRTIKIKAFERFVAEASSIVGENQKEAEEHASELRIYTDDQINSAKKQIFQIFIVATERRSEREVKALVSEHVSQMNEKFAISLKQSYCDKIAQICKNISSFEERLYGQIREEAETEIQTCMKKMFEYSCEELRQQILV